jgi:hypothetical protein
MGAKPKKLSPAAVMRRITYWKKRMLLGHWRIAVEFGKDEENESQASCLAMPEYLQATLRFDLSQIDPDEIDTYVVHELGHCAVWGLANCAHSMAGEDTAKLEMVRVNEETTATYIERLVESLTRDE